MLLVLFVLTSHCAARAGNVVQELVEKWWHRALRPNVSFSGNGGRLRAIAASNGAGFPRHMQLQVGEPLTSRRTSANFGLALVKQVAVAHACLQKQWWLAW